MPTSSKGAGNRKPIAITSDPTFAFVNRVTAILLALSLLLQCGARFGVLGFYQLNKEYIAANLCENRATKNSACQGKCYLRKQLAKVDGAENPARHNAPKKNIEETVLFFEQKAVPVPEIIDLPDGMTRTPGFQQLRDTRTAHAVFHPPASCA